MKRKSSKKEILWDKYAIVYDTLNDFYPYCKLKIKIANEINNLIKIEKRKMILLEIGCGTGNIIDQIFKIKDIHTNVNVFAIDKYISMLMLAKEKLTKYGDSIEYICGDADKINFGFKNNPIVQKSVDIVFLSLTFFNLNNKVQLLKSISKLLVTGGYLLIVDFKPGNQKKALVSAHIKNRGIFSFLKNFKNSIKLNKYTKKIFEKDVQRTFAYLSTFELSELFVDNGFSVVKTEDVYEDQATMIIGRKQ